MEEDDDKRESLLISRNGASLNDGPIISVDHRHRVVSSSDAVHDNDNNASSDTISDQSTYCNGRCSKHGSYLCPSSLSDICIG
jgi:hypothetical protein